MSYRPFLEELLKVAVSKFQRPPLSEATIKAYRFLPRHEFVPRFSADYEHWLENSPQQYPLIYSDTILLLHAEGEYISTISQPSFVLKMLDLLELKSGHHVFELGAGSGWNAALMGQLVGPAGLVESYEIIPAMVQLAQTNLQKFNLPQVHVHQGDAVTGLKTSGPYDRAIFTAGARDVPVMLLENIKHGGIALFVLSTLSGDILLCMRKVQDHFEVFQTIYCQFVKVTGTSLSSGEQDLSEVYQHRGVIHIYPIRLAPQGRQSIKGNEVCYLLL